MQDIIIYSPLGYDAMMFVRYVAMVCGEHWYHATCEVTTVVLLRIRVLWDITWCL